MRHVSFPSHNAATFLAAASSNLSHFQRRHIFDGRNRHRPYLPWTTSDPVESFCSLQCWKPCLTACGSSLVSWGLGSHQTPQVIWLRLHAGRVTAYFPHFTAFPLPLLGNPALVPTLIMSGCYPFSKASLPRRPIVCQGTDLFRASDIAHPRLNIFPFSENMEFHTPQCSLRLPPTALHHIQNWSPPPAGAKACCRYHVPALVPPSDFFWLSWRGKVP